MQQKSKILEILVIYDSHPDYYLPADERIAYNI